MKQVILDVLEDCSAGQINLASSAGRLTITNLIMTGIKTKGWFLNLSEEKQTKEQLARDTWVCQMCNENTYDVDWDYMGSGTNHLSCELEIEMKEKNWYEDMGDGTLVKVKHNE